MNNYPTVRQLQYLQALKKFKNFGEAANHCAVTQPTLSAGVKELENILGLNVLDRSNSRKVTFTEFGKEVLSVAEKIFDPLDDILLKAKDLKRPLSGVIRIGIIPTIAPYLLPIILPKLNKKFPNITFEITESMTKEILDGLNYRDLDLIILALPYDIKNAKHEALFEEEFVCIAHKDTFSKKTIQLKDLEEHKILLLEDGHCLRDHALSACKLQNLDDRKALSATSLMTLVQMATHGYGLTLLPEMALSSFSLKGNTGLFRFKTPAPKRKIGLCWPEKSSQNANIQAIRAYLKEILKP